MTLRLQSRLRSIGGGFDPLCRCQNRTDSPAITTVSSSSSSVVIKVGYGFSQSPYDINFVVLSIASRWFVDDTYCAADPSTTIYNDPVRPCPRP